MANSGSTAAKGSAAKLTAEMKRLGFDEVSDTTMPRLILVLGGREGRGKTHFALTAPDPIAYFNFDIGDEGVTQKFKQAGKLIYPQRFRKPMSFGAGGDPDSTGAKDEWLKFSRTWYRVLRVPGIRTIVLDTESDAHELVRLARLGKLTQVKPYHYGPVNSEYTTLLKAAYESDKNLILLQKMKRKYKNDKWSGEYERKGFNEMGFIAQVIATMHQYNREDLEEGDIWPEDSFAIRIEKCRQNPTIKGEEYNNSITCNFPWVATQVLPDTGLEDWE